MFDKDFGTYSSFSFGEFAFYRLNGMAVFSIRAPNEGVEKTSREPEPMAAAVS